MVRVHQLVNVVRAGVDWFVEVPWRSYIFIFILAFCLRIYPLYQIPAKYLIPTANWELGSIAISLMETGHFANPYMIPTGPTAHLPPIYPISSASYTGCTD